MRCHEHSVDIAYREGAVWTFNDYTMSLIEGIVDGNGRPLLNYANDGINVGRANSFLLGYPVVIDNSWANFSDPSTTSSVPSATWKRATSSAASRM